MRAPIGSSTVRALPRDARGPTSPSWGRRISRPRHAPPGPPLAVDVADEPVGRAQREVVARDAVLPPVGLDAPAPHRLHDRVALARDEEPDEIAFVPHQTRRKGFSKKPHVPTSHATIAEVGGILRDMANSIPSQGYFWADTWQRGERAADEDIRHGRVKRFASAEALVPELIRSPPPIRSRVQGASARRRRPAA